MADGDLIDGDRQIELRSTLMGAEPPYIIDGDGGAVRGLFAYITSQAETAWAHADGSFIGEQTEAARDVTAALLACGDTSAEAGEALGVMRTVWAKSTTEVELWFQVDGIGKGYVIGWPQGITPDESWFGTDTIPLLARFRVTDPTIYLVDDES
jgi:hypothetical protein